MRDVGHYHKDVETVGARASAQDLAEQMAREAVGCLLVVDEQAHPIGIVTDRDLALRVVAEGRPATETPAEAVMSQPLLVAEAGDPIERVIERMCSHGIRRVPILRDGKAVGLVSLDDLVVQLGSELDSLGSGLRHQFREARRSARLEEVREDLAERLRPLVEQIERAGGYTRQALLRELDSLRERMRRS